jgi:hypothetical protein
MIGKTEIDKEKKRQSRLSRRWRGEKQVWSRCSGESDFGG